MYRSNAERYRRLRRERYQKTKGVSLSGSPESTYYERNRERLAARRVANLEEYRGRRSV
jgi:hypothetical protein